MAETSATIHPVQAFVLPSKKGKRTQTRKPLQPKKQQSNNEANMIASKIASPLPGLGKENQEAIFTPSKKSMAKEMKISFEKELQELQEKLELMKIKEEQAEEMLKARDELLKQKEEELENRGKEQAKLQTELRKLQKLKEFNPNMSLPLVQTLREKEQGKNGKNKKKKQIGIKKPCAAYVLWVRDQWSQVKNENPDAEFKDISNILGARWKNVSEEEKKPYEEQYQLHKEAYLEVIGKEKREKEAMRLLEEEQKQKTANELLEQYLQFKQEADEEIKKKKKKTKKEKDPLKPKKSLTAFFLYMKERRPALIAENKSVSEIGKIAGEEWKNMPEEARRAYEEIAKKEKKEYLKELEQYKQKREEDAANRLQEEEELMKIQKQEALQLLKKKEKTNNIIKKTKVKRQQRKQENFDPNKPKRPASSFLLFSKNMRKTLLQEKPEMNNSALTALVAVKWKELNEAERETWSTEAANAMNAYKIELEDYNNGLAEAAMQTDH